ncbi:MAG: DNA recombination protein RmuC [Verrucomicrobiota bacterium]
MEYAPTILGLLTLGFLAYFILSFRSSAQNGGGKGSELLIEDLRRQLADATATAERERQAKTDALSRASGAESARNSAAQQLTEAQQANASAREQLRADNAKALADAEARYTKALADLRITFEKTSADVLKGMAPDVTKEVSTRVEPLIAQINTALESYRNAMQQGLHGQGEAIAAVNAQMKQIGEATSLLAASTNDFTSVLKSSQHRGKWGEQTLRRVVEAAGLSALCDFTEQSSQDDTRPDLIINLPENRCVIIDSKVPEFDVALANQSAPNRKELVKAHAAKLRATIKALAARNYPAAQTKAERKAFDKVILFLPAESLLSTALEGDNDLIIDAGNEGILLATPATLMGFLSAINLTWQQHKQAANSAQIASEAAVLYERVVTFMGHFTKARRGLSSAVDAFNSAIGSYEDRVRPQGREVLALGVAQGSEALEKIEKITGGVRKADGAEDDEAPKTP